MVRIGFASLWRAQQSHPSPAAALDTSIPGNKGLKADALGYISNLVIAVASTAPAYSLAATLGFIVAVTGVGVHAPAVLIVAFIPILFVSVGYRFLNLADPDAGTTFAWVTRAFGPQIGWINGWAIFLADIIVMASLAAIASDYTFLLFGLHGLASSNSRADHRRGRLDRADDMDLLPRDRAVGADPDDTSRPRDLHARPVRRRRADQGVREQSRPTRFTSSASWFNPFDLSWSALVDGVLLGIFIYWGWDSGVAVNEESRDRHRGPGKAAVVSTLILLLIYVLVTAAAQAYHGTKFLGEQLRATSSTRSARACSAPRSTSC